MRTSQAINVRESVEKLRVLFLRHGVLGWAIGDGSSAELSEADRMCVASVVYLLIPQAAIVRAKKVKYLKPVIREHISGLGVDPDEQLVEILKRVADQIHDTSQSSPFRPAKMTIAHLRAMSSSTYEHLRSSQNDRCKICGIHLDSVQQELDHVVPWRLIGDSPDGSNWQILCGDCNGGKHVYLSSHQIAENWNWVYSAVEDSALQPNRATRFSALANNQCCSICGMTPSETQLHVIRAAKLGLYVKDHLQVLCTKCSSTDT